MRASIEIATNQLIEAQSHADAETLLNNAVALGYARAAVTVREVTRAEHAALLAGANPPQPITIPLPLLQARMEAETVAAADGWTAYVNYMFGATARRNAFLKTMFIGQPLRQDNAAFRTTLAGAGFALAQQDRVLAQPPA